MSDTTDDNTALIDQALREAQQEERAEQRADLERQTSLDTGIADALTQRERDER